MTLKKTTVRVCTTRQFMALADDSVGRNRGPSEKLLKELDPEGIHVCRMQLVHNDIEWRNQWLCNLSDTTSPVEIWMDNDLSMLDTNTFLAEVPIEQSP